jgi:Ni,Fe-hydrogenase I large subunit
MAADTYERGLAIHDPKQPLEVLRTIHSFDPCLDCAVHLTTTNARGSRSRWSKRCGGVYQSQGEHAR